MAVDKYYGYTSGEDYINDQEYIYDTANEDFIKHNFDDFRRAEEVHMSKERIVRKDQIERRKLKRQHEIELKKKGLRAFLAGAGIVAAMSFGVPRFVGGEQLANDVYRIVSDAGYGWRDYENGIQFNHGTTYVSYEDAISDITYMCHVAGYSDAEIDVAFKKIFGINPKNSTFEERDNAKTGRYYQSKAEEKGMGK